MCVVVDGVEFLWRHGLRTQVGVCQPWYSCSCKCPVVVLEFCARSVSRVGWGSVRAVFGRLFLVHLLSSLVSFVMSLVMPLCCCVLCHFILLNHTAYQVTIDTVMSLVTLCYVTDDIFVMSHCLLFAMQGAGERAWAGTAMAETRCTSYGEICSLCALAQGTKQYCPPVCLIAISTVIVISNVAGNKTGQCTEIYFWLCTL